MTLIRRYAKHVGHDHHRTLRIDGPLSVDSPSDASVIRIAAAQVKGWLDETTEYEPGALADGVMMAGFRDLLAEYGDLMIGAAKAVREFWLEAGESQVVLTVGVARQHLRTVYAVLAEHARVAKLPSGGRAGRRHITVRISPDERSRIR